MTHRVLPSTAAKTTTTVNGRSFTAALGTTQDVLDADALELSANGYMVIGGKESVGTGTTANRPTTDLFIGAMYGDTTLGYIVVYDGASWRDPIAGTAV